MTAPLVRFSDITVRFANVTANDGVSFEIAPGSFHGIVGENGAGKSTIMKVLYGMYRPDRGSYAWRGEPVRFRNPSQAIARGIGMVHQHFMLVPTLKAWENISLGPSLPFGKIAADKNILPKLTTISKQYGLGVNLNAYVEDMSVGEQQQVEILRLLYRDCDLLILDEPTAVLTPQEVERLVSQLRVLQSHGKTIVLITHKLKEVLAFTDTVTVMRAGKVVATRPTSSFSGNAKALAELIIGKKTETLPKRKPVASQSLCLDAKALTKSVAGKKKLDGFSIQVSGGEIVGLAGIEGNGQQELVECLAGLSNVDSGVMTLDRNTTALIPPDRHREGCLLDFSVLENFLLGHQRDTAFSRWGLLKTGTIRSSTQRALEQGDVRPRNPDLTFRALSGGNQQKLVFQRELAHHPSFLVAAHPTRGVDIGATQAIHRELLGLRDKGVGILLISSELDELLAISDRISVIFEGRIQAEAPRAAANITQIGLWMTGGGKS